MDVGGESEGRISASSSQNSMINRCTEIQSPPKLAWKSIRLVHCENHLQSTTRTKFHHGMADHCEDHVPRYLCWLGEVSESKHVGVCLYLDVLLGTVWISSSLSFCVLIWLVFFEPVVTAIARSLIMSPITVSALHLTNPVFLAFAALFVLLVRDELLHPHAEAESSLPWSCNWKIDSHGLSPSSFWTHYARSLVRSCQSSHPGGLCIIVGRFEDLPLWKNSTTSTVPSSGSHRTTSLSPTLLPWRSSMGTSLYLRRALSMMISLPNLPLGARNCENMIYAKQSSSTLPSRWPHNIFC